MSEERPLTYVEKVAGGEGGVGGTGDHGLVGGPVEGSDADGVAGIVGSAAEVGRHVEEVLPVREEPRVAVGRLVSRGVELRHRDRLAPAGRGPGGEDAWGRREDD